jgi:hypothetical protein
VSVAAIVALICALVPAARQSHNGESEADALDRYATIARAVAATSTSDVRALYLLTVFRHESSFRRDVHAGEKRGDDGRSWCLGQIMIGRGKTRLVPNRKERAAELVGVDIEATTTCARVATAYLDRAIRACGVERPACVMAYYGGVTSEDDQRIHARVKTFQRLRQLAAAKGPDV